VGTDISGESDFQEGFINRKRILEEMKRIKALIKAITYKIKYGRTLHWDGMLGCRSLSEINIKKGKLSLGKGFSMKPGAYIAIVNGGYVSIGKNVSLNRNTILVCHEKISIGDGCAIAPNVLIYDHDHNYGINGLESGFKTTPVVIEKNCWIGAGTIILRGTHIGEGCVIGAGTVVKGDIPAHSLVKADGNRRSIVKPIQLIVTLTLVENGKAYCPE
jgi:acetyltransferase-like isoleucine patch superfamily enzyme